MVRASLALPYRLPISAIVLVALVPLYIFIPELYPPHFRHRPALALDRALPLIPGWAIVYGALYLYLIVLPIVVVRQEELLRRTLRAYLAIWIVAYAFFFLIYPTEAARPPDVAGEGFAEWGLRTLYSSDPPYNCFPSLHVAHSFVSALAVHRVNRRTGVVATLCASLVALSTLLTKQHYIADVVAGVLLALAAHVVFVARFPDHDVPSLDRSVAPALSVCVAALIALLVVGGWCIYRWTA